MSRPRRRRSAWGADAVQGYLLGKPMPGAELLTHAASIERLLSEATGLIVPAE